MIGRNKFVKLEEIGSGQFGTVFKVRKYDRSTDVFSCHYLSNLDFFVLRVARSIYSLFLGPTRSLPFKIMNRHRLTFHN